MSAHRLWFTAPAQEWEQALPLGNGRLGAMVFGGVEREHLQLNEDSIWYGGPRDRNNPDALTYLPEIRQLIRAGRIADAEQLAVAALSGVPENQRHYEPFADLLIEVQHPGTAQNYRRELDTEHAIARTIYQIEGVTYTREYFISAAHQVVVVRLSADQPGRLTCRARLQRLGHGEKYSHYLDTVTPVGGCGVRMRGGSGGAGDAPGVSFLGGMQAIPEQGTVTTIGDTVIVRDADAVTILVGCVTTFYHAAPDAALDRQMRDAAATPYPQLRGDHTADYAPLYARVTLDLGDDDRARLPTDARVQRLQQGGHDPGLTALYFNFGRYLLIACSRPGTLPATLQGLWNDRWLPPWDSKYTININIQMNYWPAEVCNLAELHEPLFALLERLRELGRRTARVMYNARGFCAHHNTDLWADTAPQGQHIPSSYWPMGAAWLCTHLWEHYLFQPDREFLQRAYPIMKEACEFFFDVLIEDPQGRLVTCPSVSPENTYILPNGAQGRLCMGPSMDSQILAALLTHTIQAAEILACDEDFRAQARAVYDRLPKPAIGKHGQVLEWAEEYEEAEPGHRHISHLWALHPGSAMTSEQTPELADAARVTLERRLAHGGGHTGWSRAWIINFWARLGDGERAWDNINALLRQSTHPNLFDNHPPFQIDGNFGGTAGIAEMLLQSHAGVIHLLPALPTAWPDGTVTGLRARGGFVVDIAWRSGRLIETTIHSRSGNSCAIRYGAALIRLETNVHATFRLNGNLETVRAPL